jgi:cell fate regulator YaaT (PSP1 superfamily)
VIATDRGIEIGQQVSLTCFGCDKSVPRDQMRDYAEVCGGEAYQLKRGRILREATEEDLAEWRHIETSIFDKLQAARRVATDLTLQMKVVDCEHIFGGERIVFYFLAEERVDFRELVRILAGEFQTRIEMRQIGARDEARLVADYETCGRECCCKTFLKTLKPISMQMAKLQKATLDPSKVSGRCGRLKCCLRYEHETYEELDCKLPKLGVRIRTNHGTGQVIDRQILTQLVKLRCDDERVITVVIEDILETNVPPPAPGTAPAADARPRGSDRSRSGSDKGRPPHNGPQPDRRRGQAPSGEAAPRIEKNDAPARGPAPRQESAPEAEPAVLEPQQETHDEPAGQEPGPGIPPSASPGAEQRPERGRGGRRRRRRRRGEGGPGPRTGAPESNS